LQGRRDETGVLVMGAKFLQRWSLLVCLHIVVIDRRDYFLAGFVENSALHCGVFKENVDE